MITPLNLPKAPLKLTKKDETVFVWCELRKKKLVLTPEEWVRQHVIHFLNIEKGIPFGRMVAEYSLTYNGREKRADILSFDEAGNPQLLVECKAPEVTISSETLFQIGQYQKILGARFLMLTNGLEHYFGGFNEGELVPIEELDLND